MFFITVLMVLMVSTKSNSFLNIYDFYLCGTGHVRIRKLGVLSGKAFCAKNRVIYIAVYDRYIIFTVNKLLRGWVFMIMKAGSLAS